MSLLTEPSSSSPVGSGTAGPPLLRAVFSVPEARWATVATALFAVGAVAQVAGAPSWVHWAFYLTCCAVGGWEPALAGLQALRERVLDVDVLMVVAAVAAVALVAVGLALVNRARQ